MLSLILLKLINYYPSPSARQVKLEYSSIDFNTPRKSLFSNIVLLKDKYY